MYSAETENQVLSAASDYKSHLREIVRTGTFRLAYLSMVAAASFFIIFCVVLLANSGTRHVVIGLTIGFLCGCVYQAGRSDTFVRQTESPETSNVKHPAQPRRQWYLPIKYAADRAIAVLLAILCLPVILLFAVLIKLESSGPAFYFQTRLGKDGILFKLIKFRTMLPDSEAAAGPVWATIRDARITRLGDLLHKSHLEDLPQIWNVIMGNMSLIGPRAERPEISGRIERSIPEFRQRLSVRPGITGVAQILFPADSDLSGVKMKLAADLYYVREVGPLLDLRIAFSTVTHFVAHFAARLVWKIVRPLGLELRLNDSHLDPTPETDRSLTESRVG